MATVRIQLSDTELATIESALSPRVSDREDLKLLVKIQRALVSAGGKISRGGNSAGSTSMTVDTVLAKMLLDEPITDEERLFYFQQTGQEI